MLSMFHARLDGRNSASVAKDKSRFLKNNLGKELKDKHKMQKLWAKMCPFNLNVNQSAL